LCLGLGLASDKVLSTYSLLCNWEYRCAPSHPANWLIWRSC
jgi:hypothetical protein